jgi:hypothetical protein
VDRQRRFGTPTPHRDNSRNNTSGESVRKLTE